MTKILAIETSCDETAAAIIEDGAFIRSNIVASQIDIHRRYGGVFPEVASRQHILAISTVVQDALIQARTGWNEVDAVAVTYGPGLAGSLLVGVNTAKGIAMALDLPLVAINHLEGHIYSNWLDITEQEQDQPPLINFPALSLIVSGGHTELILIRDHGDYEILGRTIDDAAGEAFDKVARILNVGYPGGPAIEQAAKVGNPNIYNFPRARLGDSFDFSFSGLKTAVLRVVQKFSKVERMHEPDEADMQVSQMPVADIAASFQMAVVDILVEKTKAAADAFDVAEILLAGGVSANTVLRNKMISSAGRPVRMPPLKLCTDNAAMIGAAAHWRWQAGDLADWDCDVIPNLRVG